MSRLKTSLLFTGLMLWLSGCVKEYSAEQRDPQITPSPSDTVARIFSLTGSPANCFNADIQGLFVKGDALTGDHKVLLSVNVENSGSWAITTQSVNGIVYTGAGNFISTGRNSITLQGQGTPLEAGTYNVMVNAGNTQCSFNVNVDSVRPLPCNLPENVLDMDGVASLNFTNGIVGTAGPGSYEFVGQSSHGGLSLQFATDAYPEAGEYTIRSSSESFVKGDVRVNIIAQGTFWYAPSGTLYVAMINGKLRAVFCSVELLSTLGGNGNTKRSSGSAHVIEK